jgi:hypothetical protein
LTHWKAVAVAHSVVTAATERTKCCCLRWAYGCVAVRTCERGALFDMFLHVRGVCGARSVARERHLLLSMVV